MAYAKTKLFFAFLHYKSVLHSEKHVVHTTYLSYSPYSSRLVYGRNSFGIGFWPIFWLGQNEKKNISILVQRNDFGFSFLTDFDSK